MKRKRKRNRRSVPPSGIILYPPPGGRSSPFPLKQQHRVFAFGEHAVLLFWRNAAESFFQDAIRYSPAKGLYLGYDTGYAAVPLGGKRLGQSDLGHGLRSPFRTVCRNFILPDLQAMSLFSPFSIYATYRGC
ncbi:MAG: hypothetical protein MR825_02985 [Lawsonibacter sp.]|nr:hypothetical protein [Lawsonibacter sp.]